MQARGVGRRVDWRRLLGGSCGRRPGPWSFAPRKVVLFGAKDRGVETENGF